MVGAIRGRGSAGSRSPGLIDSGSVKAGGFHFSNRKSLRFDSNTSESVLGPVLSAVDDFSNKEITVAIWHKWKLTEPVSIYDCICGAGNSYSGSNQGFGMYWLNSTSAHFHIDQYNGNFAEATGLTATDWNLLVGVYNGNVGSPNITLYANGVAGATTDDLTSTFNTSNDVEVGKTWNIQDSGGASNYTVGHSDEFAIWNSALSQDEITEIYNEGVAGFEYDTDSGLYASADSLKLWWRLGDADDVDGTDGIVDKSGNGNHGTLTDITSANFDSEVAGGGV